MIVSCVIVTMLNVPHATPTRLLCSLDVGENSASS